MSAQEKGSVADTLVVSPAIVDANADSLRVTSSSDSTKKRSGLDAVVVATADDSTVYDIGSKKVHLYKNAKVTYLDLELKAGYIYIDYEAKEMFARGIPDSTGTRIVEKPEFKEGKDSYKMDEITYNFESRKAKVINIITQQGDGYLHSTRTKIMPDKTINVAGGKYTTCDLEHPHYYLSMSKAKMTPPPDGTVIFGFSHMVVEDVPTPLFLPFGFFPQMSDRSSGLLFPRFGEDRARGFAVEGLGYYFVFGEYLDLAITTDFYSLGSWRVSGNSRYRKRYKYDGNLSASISKNVIGDKGSVDYFESQDFKFSWTHTQAPEVNPTSRFSASVSLSSTSYDKFNENTVSNFLTNSAQSSVSYQKNWEDTPFNFSTNLTHSQNNRDSSYTFGLPNIVFGVGKFAPFKKKSTVGKGMFYEQIMVNYNTNFNNSITFRASEWGSPDLYQKFNNGMQHQFGIALPTFSLLKYITLAPSVSYSQTWFFQSSNLRWDPVNSALDTIRSNSFSEFNVTQAYNMGVGLNTRLYGTLMFKKGSLINAVRHVLTPTLSFNYSPNLKTRENGWRTYQYNTQGDVREYNIFSGQAFSPPGSPKAAAISFALANQLEIKVRNRKDTSANGYTKLKLLEAFNFNASYNLLADSMNLSNISFNGRSNILDKIGFDFGFVVDPYAIDDFGHRSSAYYWRSSRPLAIGRIISFRFSFDYTISGGQGKGVESTTSNQSIMPEYGFREAPSEAYTLYYVDFNVPWSLSAGFSYSMSKSYSFNQASRMVNTVVTKTPTLDLRGDVSLTKNWKVSVTTGYDFNLSTLSTTSLNVHRDLHCFEFNFSWIPRGFRQSWSFGINVKGSVLRDALKYDKRSSFYDNRFTRQ